MKKQKHDMSRGGAAGEFPPEVGGNRRIPGIGEQVPAGGASIEHAGDKPANAIQGDRDPGAAGSGGPHGSEKESLGDSPSSGALGNAPRGKQI